MKTFCRGVSLLEILVSLVILGVVATVALFEFRAQSRSWKTESDKASVGMMAKGVLDELDHAARMVGGGLPPKVGGIKVWGPDSVRVTFVSNENGWVDTARGYRYIPGPPPSGELRVAVDSVENFPYAGYARLDLLVPPTGGSAASVTRTFTLGIKGRLAKAGCTSDTLVLRADSLLANGWNQPGNIKVSGNVLVYRIDSVTYRKSHDTLYIHRNQYRNQDSVYNPLLPYALGVDTLRLTYRHPGDLHWSDSLSPASMGVPANAIAQVRIHLVTRSLAVDYKLLQQDPSTRGYHFSTLETEVTLRNDSLTNR